MIGIICSDKFIKQIAEEISPTVKQSKKLLEDQAHDWRTAVANGEWRGE